MIYLIEAGGPPELARWQVCEGRRNSADWGRLLNLGGKGFKALGRGRPRPGFLW